MSKLQEKDLQYIWHPCSQMKDYEELKPLIIEKGRGPYLYDVNGKSYLDAVSSWWVNLFGHSNPRINQSIKEQIEKLEHVIFANFSHEPAIRLAEKIVSITPEGLNKVFFADNGSSAIEVALKLSFQYHQQAGMSQKKRFAALTDAYHGETLGALSVGHIDLYSQVFKPLLLDTVRVEGPDCYRCPFGESREHCDAPCFTHMEQSIAEHHSTLCGIIIEPLIQCAAGMKMYPPVYLKKAREICDRYQLHLIADEIAVGFGRTGEMFACEHAQIRPDIMCLSKGLTAGYMPLALTVVTDQIYDAFYADYIEQKAFMHSHSYTGNPIACAVACESLKIFEDDQVIESNREKASYIAQKVIEQGNDHPYVGEYRQLGMVGAIELVEDKSSKGGFDWKKRIGYRIYKIGLEKGIILRPLGNILYFMPPYVVTKEDIDFMVDTAFSAINEFFGLK
ncbi:adenosylmethionine--8-amino-7-oxononanoate transaminase [Heliobacterium chlorum]|uniref:Adenosylmethionine-8-amino-7-oxononanoate aminotransferase n=1 Tax=Heliobacterium chlorum TaxID=2698 RepID=A0ABR7T639_HELCL|nr:adenosylmethionine--8-amino-7-oxononanoate transaminase [Heliobacterium chlorum]MBC9786244.1 adenosylmethionine--8-amino-7-oxononanoate transaminase [Heliobacterium chlorum]